MGVDRPRLGPVLYSLVLLVGIDFIGGIWVAMHSERALEIFLGQVPVIGAAGIMWTFLPKTIKDDFGTALAGFLGHGATRSLLTVLALVVVAFTFFRASVTVAAIDGNVATKVYLVTNAELRQLDDGVPPSDGVNLNRLTSPVSFVRQSWLGNPTDFWIYTPAAIAKAAVNLRPWRPRQLQYPQDFDSLAAVAVLPGAWLFGHVNSTVRLVFHERGNPGDTVAVVVIDSVGSYLATFLDPSGRPPLAQEDLADLLHTTRDSSRSSMLKIWARTAWTGTRRPIRKGDRLEWRLMVPGDDMRNGTLQVNNVVTQLYLAE